MVETRSQNSSEEQKARLEVEVHSDPAMDENQEGHGTEERGNRRLASESTPVEQGQYFATSTGTLDQEEITHRQHHDAWRDGETGNVLIVFRMSEEHFRKLFSIYHGNGYKQKPRKKKRTMTGNMTLDLKSASLNRLRRMTYTSC